jgi:hypothetical protein
VDGTTKTRCTHYSCTDESNYVIPNLGAATDADSIARIVH